MVFQFYYYFFFLKTVEINVYSGGCMDHKYDVRQSVVKTAVDWITNGQKSIWNSFPLFVLARVLSV